jgi:MFS family permease
MAEIKSAPRPASSSQRGWSLAAAIASSAGFGLGIGQGGPLLSLSLDSHGVNATLNGVNAAAAFVGVLVGPLLAPFGVRVLGIRNFLLLGFAIEIAVFPLLKAFDSFPVWMALRAVGGLVGSSVFTASEAWINLLAGDAGRGRIIGLYAGALSLGFGVGPLILSLTGIEGWPPFLVNAGIIAIAALPIFGIGNRAWDFGRERGGNPFTMLVRAPLILLTVVLFGLHEATVVALLPIWALRLGFDANFAATTVSAVFIGSVALQWPIGYLSDKTTRPLMLQLCGAGGLLGSIAIAWVTEPTPALLIVLAVWGGIASSIYPVALSMAGDLFRGSELVTVNAAIIIAYGIGALVGPALGGMAMDWWNPNGLPIFFFVLFAGFCVATIAGPSLVGDKPRDAG